jgi:hypothetical protein
MAREDIGGALGRFNKTLQEEPAAKPQDEEEGEPSQGKCPSCGAPFTMTFAPVEEEKAEIPPAGVTK